MNKYLTKIAKAGIVGKYFNNLTGKSARELGNKIDHVTEFLGRKETLRGLNAKKRVLDGAVVKARVATGIGAAGAIGAGAYAYKRHADHQRKQIEQQLNDYFDKSASTAGQAAKVVGGSVLGGVGKVLKRVGRGTADVMNTAAGGKLNRYYEMRGINHDAANRTIHSFKGGTSADKLNHIVSTVHKNQSAGHFHSADQIAENVVNLQKQRRDARIAVGSTLAAGGLAYAHHIRNKIDAERRNQY